MRIPGLAGEIFAKLGVNVINIPAGELYTSLDRGKYLSKNNPVCETINMLKLL